MDHSTTCHHGQRQHEPALSDRAVSDLHRLFPSAPAQTA
jgi:hypothetical protein